MTQPKRKPKTVKPVKASDYDDFEDDGDGCPNCDGEGIVYSCEEEFACLHPEEGCDLCARACDWCRQ